MNLNNYMLKSLNKIAVKYGYKVSHIENSKDKKTHDIFFKNVLVLDNTKQYFDSWRYRVKVEFGANKSFRLADTERHNPWVPTDLLSELSKFIATALTLQVRHDKAFKYLVGIQEKKSVFFDYAKRFYRRNQKTHYITKDIIDTGYLYGDYYKNFEITTELSTEYKEKYGDPVTCYFIHLKKAKLIQENTKYCYDCGNPYIVNTNPETKEDYNMCYTCGTLFKIRE